MAAEDDALRRGDIIETTNTVAEWSEEWLKDWKTKRNPRATTIASVVGRLSIINRVLGNLKLTDLTVDDVDSFIYERLESSNGRGGTVSRSTVRQDLTIIKQMLSFAVKKRRLRRNVMDDVDQPDSDTRRPESITEEMLAAIISDAARIPDLLPIIYFDVRTGLRRGEVCGLQWSKIRFQARRMLVDFSITLAGGKVVYGEPKTDAGIRWIEFGSDLLEFLKRHQKSQQRYFAEHGIPWSPETYVFTNPEGNHYHPQWMTRNFKDVIRSLGYSDKLTFHSMRHAFASYLSDSGVSAFVIMDMIGHTSLSQTRRYTHPSREAKQGAADGLGEFLSP